MRTTATTILVSFCFFSLCACSVAGVSHPSGSPESPAPDVPLVDPVPNDPENSEPDPQAPVLVSEPIDIPEPEAEDGPPEETSPSEDPSSEDPSSEDPSSEEIPPDTPTSNEPSPPSQDSYNPIGIIDETPDTPPAIIISPDDGADVEVEPSIPPEEPKFPEDSEYELIPTPENIDNLIGDINPDLTEDYEDSRDYYFEDNMDPESISVNGSCKGKSKIAVIVINTKRMKKKYQSVKCRNNKFILKFLEKRANRKHLKIQILYFD